MTTKPGFLIAYAGQEGVCPKCRGILSEGSGACIGRPFADPPAPACGWTMPPNAQRFVAWVIPVAVQTLDTSGQAKAQGN